jgi:hypothetical protein
MSRKFKNWVTAYREYSSQSEAPDKFHFWTGVSVLAGALRRHVWIDQGYFQWTPNFYIVFVAPPGIVSKSTTANIGMRLLKELPDVKFGPDAVTWQALTQALAASTEELMMPDGNFHAMSCITIVSSEFGTFLNPSDREMVDVMVSLWDGQLGTWEKATKTQGSDIILNPWINLIACTTPSWIAGNFPDYMIGGGFTSRCVFVYAEDKRKLVAYPGKTLPSNFKLLAQELVHDLELISTLKGEYKLTPEAEEWGVEWYENHYKQRSAHELGSSSVYGGYYARKQTHMHKLAIVLAAAQRDDLYITPKDLQQADQYLTDIEQDMPKVFALIGKNDDARTAEAVYAMIKKHDVIHRQQLIAELMQTYGADQVETAIRGLLSAGMISQVQQGQHIIILDRVRKNKSPRSLGQGEHHDDSPEAPAQTSAAASSET